MKKFLKISLWALSGLILLPFIILFVLYKSADMGEPALTIDPRDYIITQRGDSLICNDSYLRREGSGLWELYVKGSGQRRGAVQGALTKELMEYQENVFVNKIREFIPSDRYLSWLRIFIIIFNRNLGEHIPLEYREEIAAMSQFCTHRYDAIGTPYERQLNYHAAHDIGHTMQQYMLVGCSSFGVWGTQSESKTLIIGRNFDFYAGDDFAKNKLITFAVPDSGYRYASIGWAGMTGVLSGMNECGLTVTINASKGAIPASAATPISILTREILQYASNIEEAFAIAESRKTFVSESILIGSVRDGKCAVIEKTPRKTALYTPEGESVLCTNHFQSGDFAQDSYNMENIENSDSKYRYDRLKELIRRYAPVHYTSAAAILRDRLGAGDKDIGIGNEMTLNQSIAHHSVIFMPREKLMWISTAPWQSGPIICYDLKNFFNGISAPERAPDLDLARDSLFMRNDLPLLSEYRETVKNIRAAVKEKNTLAPGLIERFLSVNPNHYYTYRLSGDYFLSVGDPANAKKMYERSLRCSIPYKTERNEIEKLIKKLSK